MDRSDQSPKVRVRALSLTHELQLLFFSFVAFMVLAALFVTLVYPLTDQFTASAEAQNFSSATPCSGLVQGEPPQGYGSPLDLFTDAYALILSVVCTETAARFSVGGSPHTQYIYRYGYAWRNNTWQRFDLTGDELVSDAWFKDSARAIFTRSLEEMKGVNYIVAYTCTWHQGAWKCGCGNVACATPQWQLQSFSYSPKNDLSAYYGDEPFPVPIEVPDIAIFYPNTYTGGHGTRITLTGYGFAQQNNTVIFRTLDGEDFEVRNIPSPSTQSLVVTVPQGIPYGVYSVIVRHAGGRSFNSAMFTVVRPGSQRPTITSISPAEVRIGATVTIRGTNFASTGNNIYTTLGIIPNVSSSDGRTLTFVLDPFPDVPESKGVWGGQEVPNEVPRKGNIMVQIANEYGLTQSPTLLSVIFR